MPRGAFLRQLNALTYFLYMQNIIPLSTNNTQITFQRQEDGYINATALCKNSNKQIGSYLRNQTTVDFLTELESVMQIRITDLVQIQQGGEPHLQGTWVHPQVAINLAQWLSPKFAVQVSKWVQDWITKKQAPQLTQKEQVLLLAKNLLQAEEENQRLQIENTKQEQIIERFIGAKEHKNYTETADIVGMPRNQFIEYLRSNSYIEKHSRRPTVKAKNLNIIETKWSDKGYERFLVTPKGISYFKRKICNIALN